MAQERLNESGIQDISSMDHQDIQRLVTELQLHAIELEMQNEELLRLQSEAESGIERYIDLYDSAPVAYFTVDRGGTIRQVNLSGAKLLKVPISGLVNSRLSLYVSPETRTSFTEFLARIFEDHARETFKADVLTKTGNQLCVQMDAIISRNDDECHITITDDPDRKLAIEALRASEERYRSIFDGAIEGIYQTTLDGKFITANSALAKMLGYDSPAHLVSEVVDSAHQVWADPNERSIFRQLIADNGILNDYECQFRRRDGQKIWVSISGTTVHESASQEICFQGFIDDITERKLAEQALGLSENKFMKVLQLSHDAVNVSHLEDGRFIDINNGFMKMMGYSREEIVGRSSFPGDVGLWVNIHDRDRMVEDLKRTGEITGLEVPFRT